MERIMRIILRRGASHAEWIFFETRMTINDHKFVINIFVGNSWIICVKRKRFLRRKPQKKQELRSNDRFGFNCFGFFSPQTAKFYLKSAVVTTKFGINLAVSRGHFQNDYTRQLLGVRLTLSYARKS